MACVLTLLVPGLLMGGSSANVILVSATVTFDVELSLVQSTEVQFGSVRASAPQFCYARDVAPSFTRR